jgi:hypothetical protein
MAFFSDWKAHKVKSQPCLVCTAKREEYSKEVINVFVYIFMNFFIFADARRIKAELSVF